jgi:histidine triad (HIT) family protein
MQIEVPKRDPCPFCENLMGRVAADSAQIKPWAFVERLDLAAAFVNPYQQRNGAVLVVPTRHAPTVLDLTEPEAESLARMVRRVAHAIHDAFEPAGLNIYQNNGVASGQTIPRYHVHVVPRYPGDRPDQLFSKGATLIAFEERVKIA